MFHRKPFKICSSFVLQHRNITNVFYQHQVVRQEFITLQPESQKEASLFSPGQPREKWLKRRTTMKLRVSVSVGTLYSHVTYFAVNICHDINTSFLI